MRPIWLAAGVMFLIAGCLELCFFALSCLGILTGGLMTFGALPNDGEQWMGPLILSMYTVFFFATMIGGALHTLAGVSIVAGRPWRPLVWAATAASILPLFTVYCAMTSLAAGVVGLVALVTEEPDAEAA